MQQGDEPSHSPEALADLVMALSRNLRRGARATLAPLGLTPAAARALHVIMRADEALRMSDLAQRLSIAPRSATSVVDALEEAGLVRREIDRDNRRSFLLALTERGESARAAVAQARRAAAKEAFGELDSGRRAELARTLTVALDSSGCHPKAESSGAS